MGALEAHVCPNCGAPLPVGSPGTVEHCRFCSAEAREPPAPAERAAPAPSTRSTPPPRPRAQENWVEKYPDPPSWKDDPGRSGRITGIICLVIGGLAVVFAFVMAVTKTSSRAARSAPARGATTPPAPSPPAPVAAPLPPLTLRDLATARVSLAWQPLDAHDAPGIVGSYRAFDPVKNLGWARAIAAAWRPDAYLYELRASVVKKDGTIDLIAPQEHASPGAWVQYWFASGACRSSSSGATNAPGCGLSLLVPGSAAASGAEDPVVRVMSTQGATSGELRDPKCTLRQALAALDKGGWLPSAPGYDVGLTDPKWTVGFVDRSKGSIGVVSAITCAAAPK
jgi:hypothetical protein